MLCPIGTGCLYRAGRSYRSVAGGATSAPSGRADFITELRGTPEARPRSPSGCPTRTAGSTGRQHARRRGSIDLRVAVLDPDSDLGHARRILDQLAPAADELVQRSRSAVRAHLVQDHHRVTAATLAAAHVAADDLVGDETVGSDAVAHHAQLGPHLDALGPELR